MIAFGIIEIIFSQIPDFDQLWWLSIVAAVMSFTYSTIGLGLGIAQVAGKFSDMSVVCCLLFDVFFFVGFYEGDCDHVLVLIVLGAGKIRGSLTGISIGTVTQTQKVWRSFQALGDIAFAYSYSIILIEIQVRIVGNWRRIGFRFDLF